MIDIDDVIGCAILDPKRHFDVEGHALKLVNELEERQRKAILTAIQSVIF